MATIRVKKVDNVYMLVDASEEGMLYDIREKFSFYAHNYRFMPKFKAGIWDGKIRLFNPYNRKLYIGLLGELKKLCVDYNYDLVIDENLEKKTDFSLPDFKEFVLALDLHSDNVKITPHLHQWVGTYHAIHNKRSLLLSPTSSGKSLMAYIMLRYYQTVNNKKTLIVVPRTSLVEQMYKDFDDYASAQDWYSGDHVHRVYGTSPDGDSKSTTKDCVISTWQSVFKLPKPFFSQFDAVIIDECHEAKADSLKGILEKMSFASHRTGMTGTLDDFQAHELVIQGLLGKKKKLISSAELMEKGLISDLHINVTNLVYPEPDKKEVRTQHKAYKDEINYLLNHEKRNEYITNLTSEIEGNTLVLFNKIDHGKLLYDMISNRNKSSQVFLVYGKTKTKVREEIRSITESSDNVIIVASYGVFSTGINIKRLHNIILASPVKSKIRLLQSIGRILRLHKTKSKAELYDLVDILMHKSYKNFAVKHFEERFNHYVKEHFDYSINTVKL